jgi:hypothetical protein
MNQRNAAMGLAALGRGADTSLIHMSPREIQALQQLAVQHGGSLTTNPETGLPEAGFLSSLLPLIAGVGLSFIPGVNALGAGLLMGAGAGIASGGDLGQMAKWGLGGYGGASLGAGLAGAGATAVAPAAGGAGAAAPTFYSGMAGVPLTAPTTQGASALGLNGSQLGLNFAPTSGAFPAVTSATQGASALGLNGAQLSPNFVSTPAYGFGAPAFTAPKAPTFFGEVATNAANTARGVTNIGSKGYGANFAAGVEGANPFGLGTKTAAFAGLGSMALEPPEEFKPVDVGGTEEVAYPAYAPLNRQALAPRNFSPAYNTPYGAGDSSEQDWFSEPNYRAYDPNIDPWNANYQSGVATAAQGGIVSLQEGGDVGEQMYFQNRDLYGGLSPTPPPPPPPAPGLQDPYKGQGTEFSRPHRWWSRGPRSTASYGSPFTPHPVLYRGNPPPPAQTIQGELDMPGGREMVLNRLRERIGGNAPAPAFSRTFVQPTEPAGSGGGELSYFNYAAGGLTAGPGDGMSDGIMTTIAGRQRAALSPGEFVVPADVVSGIGNGDTSSGAKRLYAMMDSIRNGRTGKTAQPQRINPRLPA